MTTIKIESNGESVTRIVHGEDGDDIERWTELVAPFFQMLQGMGYSFQSSPCDFADACTKLEDE